MLIGTIAILDAAFVRWPISGEWWTLQVAQMCAYPLLVLLAIYDGWSLGKIHTTTLLASALLVFSQQVRRPIGRSHAWQNFARTVQKISRP